MLDKVVADKWQVALGGKVVVVVVVVVDFASDFGTYVAYHDMQSDDGVCQDIGELEQEDGSRIHT